MFREAAGKVASGLAVCRLNLQHYLCSKGLSLKVITVMTEMGKLSALICQNQHARGPGCV